jgi:predicted helicase
MPITQNEIQNFLQSCQTVLNTGQATEHSYRKSLEILLSSLDDKITVLNEPKRQKVGAPDFILFKNDVQIGFLEAKDIPESLNDKKFNDQIGRYQALGNLCFTNNLDWKFYNGEELVGEVTIGKCENGKIIPNEHHFNLLVSYLQEFATRQSVTIKSSKQLATVMANKAKTMKEILVNILKVDIAEDNKTEIVNEYEAFKKILIHDLTIEKFSDIYSQTITYGLFTARFYDNSLDTFTRHEAANTVPKSNPFLRKLFQTIAGYDLDERLAWVVDNLVDAFAHTDVRGIMSNFGNSTKMSDPVLHFYETFLKEYDPTTRKSAGVYYTPDPVVKFIVKSVDEILKSDFNLPMGLADNSKISREITQEQATNRQGIRTERKANNHKQYFEDYHKVQVLDPATGTGTFLLEVFKTIYSKFENNQGIWKSYAQNDLLPRVHGFELLMASYSMAHLKIAMFLSQTGVEINNRLSVYLTNSLEEPESSGFDLFSQWLSQESEEASKIKNNKPVMVVIGNPPYSGVSTNNSLFIQNLIKDYKYIDGKDLNEKKHWLNDDYVKFIRYSESFIENNQEGILGYITNHSYLDNQTFRGMRQHLLKTFDKIYIIDLHGNALKKEISPDGSKDENVFDIQAGTAIILAIKTTSGKKEDYAEIKHLDIYGERKNKYETLEKNSVSTLQFTKLLPKTPYYFFVPKDFSESIEYEKGIKLSELLTINSSGIVTMGDEFAINYTRDGISNTVQDFLKNDLSESELKQKYNLGKNYAGWILSNKTSLKFDNSKITQISYRPFDNRFTYLDPKIIWRAREKVMNNMINGQNLGFVFRRQFPENPTYFYISDKIIADGLIRSDNKGGEVLAPLYFNTNENASKNLENENNNPTPNFNPELIKQIESETGLKLDWEATIEQSNLTEKGTIFTPVDLLDYIYAVLHSPQYREKYKEFLKIDFPRVPFNVTKERFWELVDFGSKLRKLHLMEASFENTITYPIEGDNIVTKPRFVDGKVYINDSQYFGNVSEIAWNFYIGGYQPAQKWLKDRKDRELSFEDIIHYQKIVTTLFETETLMNHIDS